MALPKWTNNPMDLIIVITVAVLGLGCLCGKAAPAIEATGSAVAKVVEALRGGEDGPSDGQRENKGEGR